MPVYRELSRQIASDAGRRVAERVAKQLRTTRVTLSGDDAGLANAREEFCVQVQGEESFFWDTYVESVKQAIGGALVGVRSREKAAMWLESDGGSAWLADNEKGADLPGVFEPDVIDWVYELVWQLADQARHPRVVRYLAREGGFD